MNGHGKNLAVMERARSEYKDRLEERENVISLFFMTAQTSVYSTS